MEEELLILKVWQKGHPIPEYDPAQWRWDDDGNPILFSAYGDRNSKYGWELDHIVSAAAGGLRVLSNLRPLQWEANVRRN
ncbi:MAG: HNH endonuclease [Nitrospira sp. SB0672_bin_25]|nr:HNH endonuclease [Nitrospira sp. SB0666_bin_27]MYF24783.1 HNH endonuclease [Nitrospira sp. SB0678_bin_10]MYJ54203.1 HNH endonuclease [Nitrospira sp. SB0672_bin_25]